MELCSYANLTCLVNLALKLQKNYKNILPKIKMENIKMKTDSKCFIDTETALVNIQSTNGAQKQAPPSYCFMS